MQPSVAEIARVFLKLGTIGFGGPAAHIALMESEVVQRRNWVSREEFLDLLGATNLIPGPNSTELAIHIGYRKAGFPGLLAAGICFILPAAAIVTAIAWAYVAYGSLPHIVTVFRTVKPVLIAVVLQALWGLGRSAIKTPLMAVVAASCVVLALANVHELLVLIVAATSCVVAKSLRRPSTMFFSVGLLPIFLSFLKIGSVLFGSGYVLLAFLQAEFVEPSLLTEQQLLDAVAIGQVTPGPLFTTATFVGYLLGGGAGAAIATLGIFLPAFVFVALSGPLVPRLRRSQTAATFLDGINLGSLALMAVVTVQLGHAAIVDMPAAALALAAAVGLFAFRINPAWLVAGAAMVGVWLTAG